MAPGIETAEQVQARPLLGNRQAQAREIAANGAAVVDTHHHYRLVLHIGTGLDQALAGSVDLQAAAQQVDLSGAQGVAGGLPIGVAQDPGLQLQRRGDQLQVVGSQPFVVLATGGDVEGREIGFAGADPQYALVLQPEPVLLVQRYLYAQVGAPQQLQRNDFGGKAGLGKQQPPQQGAGQQDGQAHGRVHSRALRLANSTSSIRERALSLSISRVL
ncbi:hypothetical protein D3C85_1317260 [compost metagenome]